MAEKVSNIFLGMSVSGDRIGAAHKIAAFMKLNQLSIDEALRTSEFSMERIANARFGLGKKYGRGFTTREENCA